MVRAMMHVGSIITAPKGFGSLDSKTDYYLFASNAAANLVHLVWLSEEGEESRWRAFATSMSRSTFEDACLCGHLLSSDRASTLPPWLALCEGRSLEDISEARQRKKTPKERCEERFEKIQGRSEKVPPSVLR
jgi:hypothetical protein